MRTPILCGVIKRRFLLNYRAEPEVVRRLLPAPFSPTLYHGYAIAGVCLVRVESVRPRGLPAWVGVNGENAVHRVAANWVDSMGQPHKGVFVARRDTDLWLAALFGRKLFAAEYHRARFAVEESAGHVEFACRSLDRAAEIHFSGDDALNLPASSCFKSLQEDFFRTDSSRSTVIEDSQDLNGIAVESNEWKVQPIRVNRVFCSFFDDKNRFPPGTIEFDHALVMRDIAQVWHLAPATANAPNNPWLRPIEPSSPIAIRRETNRR
jgi:uncharacterized protein YqjF (DUF2071 family)